MSSASTSWYKLEGYAVIARKIGNSIHFGVRASGFRSRKIYISSVDIFLLIRQIPKVGHHSGDRAFKVTPKRQTSTPEGVHGVTFEQTKDASIYPSSYYLDEPTITQSQEDASGSAIGDMISLSHYRTARAI